MNEDARHTGLGRAGDTSTTAGRPGNSQRAGRHIRSELGMGGYYMAPPTPGQARHFMRPLSYDERITIVSGGFHRGPATEHCYRYKEFVELLAKREMNNPAGGVRKLDRDEVVRWIGETVGDETLALAVDAAFANASCVQEAVDTVRIISFVRLDQYKEVLADEAAEEGKPVGGKAPAAQAAEEEAAHA